MIDFSDSNGAEPGVRYIDARGARPLVVDLDGRPRLY